VSDKVDFDLIKNKFGEVYSVMKDMALLNASAHLRSVSREGSCSADELIAFGKDPSWQKEVLEYGKKVCLADGRVLQRILRGV